MLDAVCALRARAGLRKEAGMKTSPGLIALLIATVAAGRMLAADPATPAPTAAAAAKNVTPEEAAKLIQDNKEVTVLDLRTEDEFKAGHIPGAKNIDFMGENFAAQLAALDKSKPYLIHCASGGRSTRSLKVFNEQKFQAIFHLNQGFKAWEGAGKPVEK